MDTCQSKKSKETDGVAFSETLTLGLCLCLDVNIGPNFDFYY